MENQFKSDGYTSKSMKILLRLASSTNALSRAAMSQEY